MTGTPTPETPDNPSAEPPSAPQAAPEPASAAPAVDADAAAARIAELDGQIADLTDRLLRAHAEMDNMRKRAEREKADIEKYAITRFARDVVGVGDNFGRAISAVPAGAAEEAPALKSLIDGVAMTEREFLNVLERHGVRRVDPSGEAFNPHLHQAVMEQPNESVAAGTVLQVFQAGFVIEDRVLRPAMVVVSRGGSKPKAAAPAEAADAAQPAEPPPATQPETEPEAGAPDREPQG